MPESWMLILQTCWQRWIEEESSRIELEDGYTLILVDIPTTEIRMDKEAYTTIPLGHHSDEGCDHYGVYRGYTCASVLCARQSEGV